MARENIVGQANISLEFNERYKQQMPKIESDVERLMNNISKHQNTSSNIAKANTNKMLQNNQKLYDKHYKILENDSKKRTMKSFNEEQKLYQKHYNILDNDRKNRAKQNFYAEQKNMQNQLKMKEKLQLDHYKTSASRIQKLSGMGGDSHGGMGGGNFFTNYVGSRMFYEGASFLTSRVGQAFSEGMQIDNQMKRLAVINRDETNPDTSKRVSYEQSKGQIADIKKEILGIKGLDVGEGLDISETLIKNGMDAESVKKNLKTIYQTAMISGEEDMGNIATQFTSVANAYYHENGKNMIGHVADVFTEADNRSLLSFKSITESLKYMGATAKVANLSLEDSVSMLEVLSNRGISGSTAGRGINSFLMKLYSPNKNEMELMNHYGIKTADKNGKILPVFDIIDQFKQKIRGLSEDEKIFMLGQFAGKDHAKTILNLIEGSDLAQLKEASKIYKDIDGATDKSYTKIIDDNNLVKVKELNKQIQEGLRSFTNQILTEVGPAIDWVTEKLKQYNTGSPTQQADTKNKIVDNAILYGGGALSVYAGFKGAGLVSGIANKFGLSELGKPVFGDIATKSADDMAVALTKFKGAKGIFEKILGTGEVIGTWLGKIISIGGKIFEIFQIIKTTVEGVISIVESIQQGSFKPAMGFVNKNKFALGGALVAGPGGFLYGSLLDQGVQITGDAGTKAGKKEAWGDNPYQGYVDANSGLKQNVDIKINATVDSHERAKDLWQQAGTQFKNTK
jgi:TP901 family phage tail tape measure protein